MLLNRYTNKNAGFTTIELMIVISIMGVLFSVALVNFNAQRVPRNLSIAQNETVTNLRKVQGYTLSSRDTSSAQPMPIKFYVVKLKSGTDQSSYEVGAIDSSYTYSVVETVKLPTSSYIADVKRGVTQATGVAYESSASCMQIIFSVPFGKPFIRTQATTADCTADTNATLIAELQDPIKLNSFANKAMQLIIKDSRDASKQKNIYLKGVSGSITVD